MDMTEEDQIEVTQMFINEAAEIAMTERGYSDEQRKEFSECFNRIGSILGKAGIQTGFSSAEKAQEMVKMAMKKGVTH